MGEHGLIIVGASARAGAFSALRAGMQVYAADLFADVDLAAQCPVALLKQFPDSVIPALSNLGPKSWMFTGGLENHPALVSRAAGVRVLLGNGGAVLTAVRDPFRVAESLQSAGLPVPEVRSFRESPPQRGDWLIKPLKSAGGRGIRPFVLAGRASASQAECLQQKISGTSAAAVFVAANQQAQLLGVTEQLVGPSWTCAGEFQYAGSLGPLEISPNLASEIARLGRVLAADFPLQGLFGVDGIIADDRLWPVEINPRYSASVEILERASGQSAVAAHVAACQFGQLTSQDWNSSPMTRPARTFGKVILYSPREFTFPRGLAEQLLRENSTPLEPRIADIPQPGTLIRKGDPILTLFAEGASVDEAREVLQCETKELYGRIADSP